VEMARGGEVASTDLEHGYSAAELEDLQSVIRHLFTIQQLVLRVNQQYIASAAMEDAYRTEPAFKLQGSYRNMNKLAEKVAPAMNADEIEAVLDDHYVSEAQTLTTAVENNLLKLAEMRGRMSAEQQQRWEHIKTELARQRMLGGADDDPAVRVAGVLTALRDQLEGIRSGINDASERAERTASERAAAASAARAAEGEQGSDSWQWMATYLAKVDAILDKLAQPELKVRVENQPPPGLDQLLGGQVELLENTLVPLTRLMSGSVYDARRVGDQITEILNRVKDIEQKVTTVTPPASSKPATRRRASKSDTEAPTTTKENTTGSSTTRVSTSSARRSTATGTKKSD
jgi:hypothetical protein